MMENNNVEPAETNSSDQSHPNFEAATTTVATMPTVHTKPATSTRKVEANRKNSLKSTGPKTAAGKRRVSRNAVKFGLFSKYLLVPHADGLESQGELDELHGDAQPFPTGRCTRRILGGENCCLLLATAPSLAY
jgi:hypothetical protein